MNISPDIDRQATKADKTNECCIMQPSIDIKRILRYEADALVKRAGTMRHLADSLPDNLQEDVKTMILTGISN